MKQLRILVVEDSENDALLMLRELGRGDYEIVHERVFTREAMREALEKKSWDIVISDYVMPNFNALEALAVLKESRLDLPFIVVSGTIGEETAVEAMKAGAYDYLMKGKLQRLLPAVEREIREAKVRNQRVQSEIALYESEEKFRFMFEHSPVPMWVADRDTWTFIEVNEAAVSCYGYTRSEFLKLKVSDLQASAGDTPPDQINMVPLISSSHRMVGEAVHKLRNGELIEVEIHSDALELGGKKLILVIVQDITRRKQAERELIQAREAALEASRLKSEFLANVSHEIRTPLNGIIGAAGFLAKASLSAKEKDWAEIIKSSGDALLAIVNQVLDFSKIESGKLEFERIDFDLGKLVKETVDVFSYAAKNKNLTLETELPAGVPAQLQGDPGRLRQVIVNLLDNAVKFTEKGDINVLLEKVAEDEQNITVRFSIRDTGIGIQDSALGRLFRPFSQADSSLTRRYGGTGLGLAICEKIITLMGGEIGVDSRWGEGSTFWFRINLKKSDGPQEKKSEPGADGRSVNGHSKKSADSILVVEDSQVNQKVIMAMVRKMGYKAFGVDDGKKAVKALDEKDYSAVLMDCQMPVMDGYEATMKIREKEASGRRHTPIIAVTAHAMKGDREKCMQAGMDDYIPKPVNVQMLAAALRKWISP